MYIPLHNELHSSKKPLYMNPGVVRFADLLAHNASKTPTMRGQLPIITSKAKVNPGRISLEWNPGIDIEETSMSMNPGHQLYGSEYTGVT